MGILLFLFPFLSLDIVLSELCPPPEDIYPCKCSENGQTITAQCALLTTLVQLTRSIRGFDHARIEHLTLRDSSFEYLPCDLFLNTTLRRITLTRCFLSRIGNFGEPQFQGQEHSLESVTIVDSFSRDRALAYVFLGHLRRMTSLEVRRSYVGRIHNDWFKDGPVSLQVLRFVEGHILSVGWKAFAALPNLKVVDLSDNELAYMARSMFPRPALHLEELNLERNQLEILEEDLFADMPSLRTVDLDLNELATIDAATWGNVWDQLNHLDIDYNPLVCDRRIQWIYEREGDLESKLTAVCYKPPKLTNRELHSLHVHELH